MVKLDKIQDTIQVAIEKRVKEQNKSRNKRQQLYSNHQGRTHEGEENGMEVEEGRIGIIKVEEDDKQVDQNHVSNTL